MARKARKAYIAEVAALLREASATDNELEHYLTYNKINELLTAAEADHWNVEKLWNAANDAV